MKKKTGKANVKKGDSRSKASKQKQGMTTYPFPGDCGKGSGSGKTEDHQWGSGVKGKCF